MQGCAHHRHGAHPLHRRNREREREKNRERERKSEGEIKKEREIKRERERRERERGGERCIICPEFLFFKGMMGALAPFSYLVFNTDGKLCMRQQLSTNEKASPPTEFNEKMMKTFLHFHIYFLSNLQQKLMLFMQSLSAYNNGED
jgi:hypothetical protein